MDVNQAEDDGDEEDGHPEPGGLRDHRAGRRGEPDLQPGELPPHGVPLHQVHHLAGVAGAHGTGHVLCDDPKSAFRRGRGIPPGRFRKGAAMAQAS
jgi:hypothetical protein